MEDHKLVEYLMYTPLDKLPAMPNAIESDKNTKLGLGILRLLNEGKIHIDGMDSNGILHVKH